MSSMLSFAFDHRASPVPASIPDRESVFGDAAAWMREGSLKTSLNVLFEAGVAAEIWRAGSAVADLLMVHFVRFEDPAVWMKRSMGNLSSYVGALTMVRESLAANPKIINMLHTLWAARPDIALFIGAAALQSLAVSMPAVHPTFVEGCATYLACTLPHGWQTDLEDAAAFDKVHTSINIYMGAVGNPCLDTGHWHELWAAGKDIALCLLEHFLLHENQAGAKWSSDYVKNPKKYLNRNLQNVRDMISSNRHAVNMLQVLRATRPDISLCVDGKALQRIATKLRSHEVLMDFMGFLMHCLPEGWLAGAPAPHRQVHSCIDVYISHGWNLTAQAMSAITGRQSHTMISMHPQERKPLVIQQMC